MTVSPGDCRRSMRSMVWLVVAALAIGVLIGGSVVMGVCAVVYMINAQ